MTTQQEKSHDDGDETMTPQTEPGAPAPTSSPTPEWPPMLVYDPWTHTGHLQDARPFHIAIGVSEAIAALEKPLRAAESLDDPGLYHRLEAIMAALRGIAAGSPAEEPGR